MRINFILCHVVPSNFDRVSPVSNEHGNVGLFWGYTPRFFRISKPIGSMYAIYGNIDPINIGPMLVYIPYMDPMGNGLESCLSSDFLAIPTMGCPTNQRTDA